MLLRSWAQLSCLICCNKLWLAQSGGKQTNLGRRPNITYLAERSCLDNILEGGLAANWLLNPVDKCVCKTQLIPNKLQNPWSDLVKGICFIGRRKTEEAEEERAFEDKWDHYQPLLANISEKYLLVILCGWASSKTAQLYYHTLQSCASTPYKAVLPHLIQLCYHTL
ncbi:hypothetical protein BsWGS_11597 [Bradybaena similaris]